MRKGKDQIVQRAGSGVPNRLSPKPRGGPNDAIHTEDAYGLLDTVRYDAVHRHNCD